ncbi:hypothetical protein Tco_0790306 [Tanacetum coccineum]
MGGEMVAWCCCWWQHGGCEGGAAAAVTVDGGDGDDWDGVAVTCGGVKAAGDDGVEGVVVRGDGIGGPEDLEELLMNDDINGELGNFLQDNYLLPDYEDPGVIPLSPNRSLGSNWDPFAEIQDSNNNMGINSS